MQPCKKIGIEITKKCINNCNFCFHFNSDDFKSGYDKPLEEIKSEIIIGKEGGCNQVVAVGWGETMMYPDIYNLTKFVNSQKMKFSIITSGNLSLDRYKLLYETGLDHLHISLHGLGDTLNKVTGTKTAAKNQGNLIYWLHEKKLPWRSNTTLQQDNYKQLPDIARYACDHGVKHFVALNFLPHYHNHEDTRKIAVHPEKLQRYIEEAMDICHSEGVMTTIRYQPFCHLKPKYWRYVTNALHVVYDTFEWCYNNIWPNDSYMSMWRNAQSLARGVEIEGFPCSMCKASLHCGKWNRNYMAAYDGADLKPITKVPDEYEKVWDRIGGVFDMNPANSHKGSFR